MPNPRIFISHSAKEPRTLKVLDALALALEKEGFEVLLDRVRLQPNDTWREEILRWPLQCHASVILFSDAVLNSESGGPSRWVKAEAGLLVARRHVSRQFGGDFKVLTVFFDPVKKSSLKGTDFEPLGIPEIQNVKADTDEALVEKIVEQLLPLRESFGDLARYGTLQRNVGDVLINNITAERRESTLAALAEKLGTSLDKCEPGADRWLWIASKILRADFRRLRGAAQVFVPFLGQEKALRLCKQVAPFCWVDEGAAERIAEVLRRPEGTRAVGLNTQKKQTAEHYVSRASTSHPPWPMREYEGGASGAQLEEFVQSVRANVKSFLGIAQEAEVSDKELNDDLTDEFDDGRPLFILVQQSPLPDNGVIEAALAAFPSVTLLLLTGETSSSEFTTLNLPQVEFILPELDKEWETKAEQQYKRLLDYVEEI